MTHTLVTFLGKGRDDPKTGYRTATYRFPDGTEDTTPFFSLALARHLRPEALVLLGTRGSMWDVLIEHVSEEGEDDLRLELMDAVAAKRVDQTLLERLRPLAERGLGLPAQLRLIPYGRAEAEQRDILEAIAEAVTRGRVSFDLTHAFRHLGMLGLVSAFFLERVGKLDIAGLYYGAIDMSEAGVAPVLRLDGLNAIQRWVDALDRFDASGDYGIFAPLLEADGVPRDKAGCLEAAAFHERSFNLSDAARKLRTFLPVLGQPLPGASGLFQKKLAERLKWVGKAELHEQQRSLAYVYLSRRDYVRAAVFGWEALLSRECSARGLDPQKFKEGREAAAEALEAEIQAGEHQVWKREAYWMLKNLRNALAHGNPPSTAHFRRPLESAEKLREAVENSFRRLLG